MMQGLLESTPFVPHSYQHLVNARVFPQPLPPAAYEKWQRDYAQLTDVAVQRIAYESDGLRITGISALPSTVTPGQHPVLLYNRGGNREYGKLTLLSVFRSMLPYARAGYLVFASNYRGNDGGEGEDQFGGDDVHDVLRLLDIAKAHPGYDGKNAFMIGHSRGGMMTYLAIKRGAALRAAAGLAGVSHLLQSVEERPEMQRVFASLIPQPNEQAYRDRSALCWPEALQVPLMLLHGDADDRVDVSHSIKLAEALVQAGKPCDLHIYPGDNHALLRNWDNVLEHTLAWMEKYRI